jgi:hypothetical protein
MYRGVCAMPTQSSVAFTVEKLGEINLKTIIYE